MNSETHSKNLKPLSLPMLQLPDKVLEEIEKQKIDTSLAKLSLMEIQIVVLKMRGLKQTDIAAQLGIVDSTVTVALRRDSVKEVMSIYYEDINSDLQSLLGLAVENLREGLKGKLILPNQLESTKVVLKACGKLEPKSTSETKEVNNYYQTLIQLKKEQEVENDEIFKNRGGFDDRALLDDSK